MSAGINSAGAELSAFLREVARRLELGEDPGCSVVKLLRNAADEIERLEFEVWQEMQRD